MILVHDEVSTEKKNVFLSAICSPAEGEIAIKDITETFQSVYV